MRKIMTCYFLVVTFVNVFIYRILGVSNKTFGELFEHHLGKDEPIPHLTEIVLDSSVWTLILAGFSLLFLVISVKSKKEPFWLKHVLILILIIMILALLATIIGYSIPFIEPFNELGIS